MNVSDLRTWIDRCASVVEEAGSLALLRLQHINAAEQMMPVGTWAVDPQSEESLSAVKMEIVQTAENTATAWRGFNRFALQAYYGKDQAQGGYFAFSVDGSDREARPGPTEPANLVGMLSQQMRHNEALTKLLVTERGEQTQLMMRSQQQLSAELESVRASYYANLKTQEEQIMQVADRELARVHLTRSEDRKDKIFDQAAQTIPMLVNRVSQKYGGPTLMGGGTEPTTMMMKNLMQSMDDTKLAAFMAMFPDPIQQAQLLEIYNTLVREPAKAAAQKVKDEAASKQANERGEAH